MLQSQAVLLLETAPVTSSRVIVGARASWKRYRGTVIENVDIGRLRSVRLLSLRADFYGAGMWAGMSASQEQWATEGKRVKGFSMEVSNTDVVRANLPSSREIGISTTWRVDGPADRRVIGAPVTIECRSSKPVEVWTVLQPLLRAQDLLSLCYGGFVEATMVQQRLI